MAKPRRPRDHNHLPQGNGPKSPRYCPSRPFPPYRHLPGVTPHPERDPEGHSYDREEDSVASPDPERWEEDELYLYGVDLFNHRYWWEAHQAWEALWFAAGKETIPGIFLQALIQLAAALIKREQGNPNGVRKLSRDARQKFEAVLASGETEDGWYMGLHVSVYLEGLEQFFGPYFEDPMPEGLLDNNDLFPRIFLKLS